MIKEIKKELLSSIRLIRMAPSFRNNLILSMIFLIMGFASLTSAAIMGNVAGMENVRSPFSAGIHMSVGAFLYAYGCMSVALNYKILFCADYILSGVQSKKLLIGTQLRINMLLSLTGYTLIVLIECFFSKNSGGELLVYLACILALMVYCNGIRRWPHVILFLSLIAFFYCGSAYFFTGYVQKEINAKTFLLLGTKWFGFFREKMGEATGTGYLILFASFLVQYVLLRLDWKWTGKFFNVMKKKYT